MNTRVARKSLGSALVPSAGAGVPPAWTSLRTQSQVERAFPNAAFQKSVAARRRDQHARRARSPERGAWWFVVLLLLAAPLAAQETVIVPYDPTKPVAAQQPDQFYLPYERFLQLWEAAKKQRSGPPAAQAPAAYALSAARYEGVIAERAATFTGQLEVTTFNDAWVKVPLPFADVQMSGLKIDGVAAAYEGGEIIVEKPGRHRVEVTFEIPLPAGARAVEWGVPRTGATLLALTLPDERTRAVITPSSGVIERVEGGRNLVTAAVGTTDRVRVELKAGRAGGTLAPLTEALPAVATVSSQVLTRLGREQVRADFVFNFPGAARDRFTIHLEDGLALFALDAPNLKSWRFFADGARRALELTLSEPVEEQYACSLTADRPLPPLPADLRTPVFTAAAQRVEHAATAVLAGPRFEVAITPSAELRQIPGDVKAEGAKLIGAYAGAGPLAYRVALAEPRREARIDYVYQVNRRKIELIASLQLTAKGDDIFSVDLKLPQQFEVQAIESPRLQDWWREDDTLHLRLSGATPEVTPLVVYLVRQFAAAPTELELRALVLTGFKKVGGEAVIAAHKGVDTVLRLSPEAKEVAPEQAATDFQILPPLERKRGFTFKSQDFSGQVTLTTLPAKTQALWVLHAQAHEGWLALSTHARLTLRQGSVDRVSFTLPASLPEARVSGGEVRETRSRVEGERRLYDVQFQNDVHDAVEFTVEVELPHAGEVGLPAIAFPDAQMTTGFVLTENASEFEMKLKTGGVDPVTAREIPFLPALTRDAGMFRVQPAWSIAVGVERLEKATARAAFVAWAELTSALRRGGTEWHRASYRLQNRSLQFLPVRLPAGAELMSVRVAGENVRADAGQIQERAVILVPLLKTKPGDLSYDVEVVYRLPREALGWWTRRELRDPELPGITIERTFWNVWLPEDRRLRDSTGNMEAVVADLNRAEKLEGKVQELKSLLSVVKSRSSSVEVREKARANFKALQQQIDSEVKDENFEETNSYFRRSGATPKPTPAEASVGKKGIAQQSEAVRGKRRAITEALGLEVQKLAEADAQQPMEQPANAPAGASTSQSRAENRMWSFNSDYGAQVPAVTPVPQAAGVELGANLYLNDNVVLQQRQTVLEKKADDRSKNEGQMVETFKLPALQLDGAETLARQKGEKVVTAASEELSEQTKDQALNTARGNTLRYNQQQQQRMLAGNAAQVPQTTTAAPVTAVAATPAPNQNAPQRGAIRAPAQAADVTPPTARADADEQRRQRAGRISLDVDFPLEGQVFHFQKVKGSAQLGLSVLAPKSFERWGWLLLGLVLAAVFFGVRRLADGRPLRG